MPQIQIMHQTIRVRFAPSPTGALHIGGVRTALFNYLLAKKHNGTFILRIEDTDQNRFVPGAEDYIIEALAWCGLHFDEGPMQGGPYGPYRQSERKHMYAQFADQLIQKGHAYYAFDSAESLEHKREEWKLKFDHSATYNALTRLEMKNSLTMSAEEVSEALSSGQAYTIRLKMPASEDVRFTDIIRGEVSFNTSELDDKIILKGDGMPTYHLANVVDDYLMKITHVIRGEEWLSSTAHHVLLYRFLEWESVMPQFAHLPLILKPDGKGKLSKRDGVKLGMPVFPLSWEDPNPEDSFTGFREAGFDPDALINFLAFLGWNPGTEQEIFSMEELIEAFDLSHVSKGGARFDFDKIKWFNQQYLKNQSGEEIASHVTLLIKDAGWNASEEYLAAVCHLLKDRITVYPDIVRDGVYFFTEDFPKDTDTFKKKWNPEHKNIIQGLADLLGNWNSDDSTELEHAVKDYIANSGLGLGQVLPILRIAIAGTLKGPDLFQTMMLIGLRKSQARIQKLIEDSSHLPA